MKLYDKDLFGNTEITKKQYANIFSTLGASNHTDHERQTQDYYATEPAAVAQLLDREQFSKTVLEPAVGGGHIAGVLKDYGYNVIGQDIVDRGYSDTKLENFLVMTSNDCDIVTNPPYVLAQEFIEHALNISKEKTKIAMLLKLQFLEGQARKLMFEKYPIKTLYVFSKRVNCAKNGDFTAYSSSAIAYGWYIWEKGYKGQSVIKWI